MVHCEPRQPLPSAAAPDPTPAHLVELLHQRPAPLAHCRLPRGHGRGWRQQQQEQPEGDCKQQVHGGRAARRPTENCSGV